MEDFKTLCDDMIDEKKALLASPEPSQRVLFWASQMLDIQQEIDEIELQWKYLKNKFEHAEQELFNQMTSNDIDSFKYKGFSFSPTIKTRASIKASNKVEALEWLKSSDYAEIVKEQVNAQTLTSLVKEWLDNGMGASEREFMEMLNIYDDQKISMRKGR